MATNYVNERVFSQQRQAARREERQERYKEKRVETYETKHRENELSLHKWDFLRSFRADKEAEVAERVRNRKQMTLLLIHAYKDQILREIYQKFKDRCEVLRI